MHRQGLWLEPWRERLFQIFLVRPTQAIAPHVIEKIVTDFLLFQCIFKPFTLTMTALTALFWVYHDMDAHKLYRGWSDIQRLCLRLVS